MATTRGRSGLFTLALVCASIGMSVALAELAFRGYARLAIFPRWERQMANPNFFLTASQDPVLGYELRAGYEVDRDGKRLRINRFGVRDDSDDPMPGRTKLAILGDSVTIGVRHSQDRTISRLLEERLRAAGESTAVINFGVPGYSTRELAWFLRQKNEFYRVDEVIYLLNPNDFARRDSVYEGGDNGLYRMFVKPGWYGRWFVRKAVYRLVKAQGTTAWYQWLFAANEIGALGDVQVMHEICLESGASFAVVLLPSLAAYSGDGYALDAMNARILAFLEGEGIRTLIPIEAFADDPQRYLDETDHLYDAGNVRMAEVLEGFVLALRRG